MVRNAIADDRLLPYFASIGKQNSYSVGLILGQFVAGKDYVIHVTKTPAVQAHDEEPVKTVKNINEIDEEWVADHARQATRMLPGGIYVLGIFVVSPEDILNPFATKIKGILNRIHKLFEKQTYLFGNLDSNEKLVLNYVTKTQQFTCKTYDTGTGSVKPAEFKFLNNPLKWVQLECKYVMDLIYLIEEQETDSPLKKHMGIILETISKNLKSSVYLYDGELKDGDESLESLGKGKIPRNQRSNLGEEPSKLVQLSILQPLKVKDPSFFEIADNANQIRIFGQVVSKLWLHPKLSINASSEAVIQDIMRSLSTRFEMHWDSLTEEEHGEDMNSVHEPPRRVLITLPESKVAISDYLFPGEGPNDAKVSLEEMMDIKIHNDSDVVDVEGQADLTEYYSDRIESVVEEVMTKKSTDDNKSLYFIGLGVALLVLIISLVIHFSQRN